jgi:hypothetical protein
MPNQKRQLAAIIFTDIVGYTALMGKDSSKALNLIHLSKEIQKPLVEKHNGKWLKEMGDGTLAQFNSALDAVRTYGIQGVGLPIPDINDKKQLSGHFFAELKRRGVLRAGIAYILLSMILILLIPSVKTILELPLWLPPVVNTIIIIVFPITLLLAWSYERSPQGFVKTTSVTSWGNPYSISKRKPFTSNLIIGILVIITVFAYGYSNFSKYSTANKDLEIKRFHILFPEDAPLSLLGESSAQWSYSSMALSPDGKMLVYTGWRNGRSQLLIRYIDNTEVIPIEGTEGAYGPFFSPDGKWIAFSTQTMLRKVKIPDGNPVNITPVTLQSGVVWTENDNIIFSNNTAIFRVSSRGETPELISTRDADRVMDDIVFLNNPKLKKNRSNIVGYGT